MHCVDLRGMNNAVDMPNSPLLLLSPTDGSRQGDGPTHQTDGSQAVRFQASWRWHLGRFWSLTAARFARAATATAVASAAAEPPHGTLQVAARLPHSCCAAWVSGKRTSGSLPSNHGQFRLEFEPSRPIAVLGKDSPDTPA